MKVAIFAIAFLSVLSLGLFFKLPSFSTVTNALKDRLGKNGICKRRLTQSKPDDFTSVFKSGAICIGAGSLKAKGMLFTISSRRLPLYTVAAGSASTVGTNAQANLFGSSLAFVSIFEYMDRDGVPGYQPGGSDIINREFWLADGRGRNRTKSWSKLNRTTSVVNGNTNHQLSTTLLKDVNGIGKLEFGVDIVPDVVSTISSNGQNKTKTILKPNAFKITIDIEDIKYKYANSTGFGIRTLLVAAGKLSKKAKSAKRSVLESEPSVEETTDDQTSYKIEAAGTGEQSGFFSWKKFVFAKNGSEYDIIASSFSELNETSDSNVGKIAGKAKFKFKQVFFSIPNRIENFEWDPAMGADDSFAANVKVSIFAFVVALLFVFFSM